uniref:31 kDa protein n=1 Tax=Beet necrotic yellow vein virus TaxID=31721 RepID=A0A0G2YHA4_9VIRU|nr:31 kDa protein [Beet necrotic yellow vein virus]
MADGEICRCQVTDPPLIRHEDYDCTARMVQKRIEIGPLGVLLNLNMLFHMSRVRHIDVYPYLNNIMSIPVSLDVPVSSGVGVGRVRVLIFTTSRERVGIFHGWQVVPGCFLNAPCYSGVDVLSDELCEANITNTSVSSVAMFNGSYRPEDVWILLLTSSTCYGYHDVVVDIEQCTLPSNIDGCVCCSGVCYFNDNHCFCGRRDSNPFNPPCFQFIKDCNELYGTNETKQFICDLVGDDNLDSVNTLTKEGWRRFCDVLWNTTYGDVESRTFARFLWFVFYHD